MHFFHFFRKKVSVKTSYRVCNPIGGNKCKIMIL